MKKRTLLAEYKQLVLGEWVPIVLEDDEERNRVYSLFAYYHQGGARGQALRDKVKDRIGENPLIDEIGRVYDRPEFSIQIQTS